MSPAEVVNYRLDIAGLGTVPKRLISIITYFYFNKDQQKSVGLLKLSSCLSVSLYNSPAYYLFLAIELQLLPCFFVSPVLFILVVSSDEIPFFSSLFIFISSSSY